MRACAYANAAAGLALLVVFSFAGCGGKPPEAKSPTEAKPASSEPASTEPSTTGEGTEKGSATEGDKGDKNVRADKAGEDTETRTTEVIQKIVQDNRKPIRACFDKAKK